MEQSDDANDPGVWGRLEVVASIFFFHSFIFFFFWVLAGPGSFRSGLFPAGEEKD